MNVWVSYIDNRGNEVSRRVENETNSKDGLSGPPFEGPQTEVVLAVWDEPEGGNLIASYGPPTTLIYCDVLNISGIDQPMSPRKPLPDRIQDAVDRAAPFPDEDVISEELLNLIVDELLKELVALDDGDVDTRSDKLRAARNKWLAENGWLPMDTAPRDCETVIVLHGAGPTRAWWCPWDESWTRIDETGQFHDNWALDVQLEGWKPDGDAANRINR